MTRPKRMTARQLRKAADGITRGMTRAYVAELVGTTESALATAIRRGLLPRPKRGRPSHDRLMVSRYGQRGRPMRRPAKADLSDLAELTESEIEAEAEKIRESWPFWKWLRR
jgi:hypothetical protein